MATRESAYEAGYDHGKKYGVTSLTQTYARNGTNEGANRAAGLDEAWLKGMRDGAAGKARNLNSNGGKRRKTRKSKSRKSKKSRKSRR
jgi:hypothetical protein